jgi:hypothetical protein
MTPYWHGGTTFPPREHGLVEKAGLAGAFDGSQLRGVITAGDDQNGFLVTCLS